MLQRFLFPAAALALLFVFLPFWSSPGRADDGWMIKVKNVAVAQGKRVVFSEIATPLKSLSRSEWRSLKGTTLWQSPAEGRRQTIPKSRLRELLGQYIGSMSHYCTLPGQLVVQGKGRVAGQDRIAGIVRSWLQDKAGSWDGEVRIRKMRLPEHVFFDREEASIRCKASSGLEPGHNSLTLEVVDVRGRTTRKMSASVFIDLWRTVPCAARPMKRLETLTHEVVRFEKKNLAHLPYEVWDGRGGPWRMKRTAGTGQVLYARMLEPLPVVSRGDEVALFFRGRSIRLRVPARVLEDADIGDTVKVKNLQSQQDVVARVRSGNMVTVDSYGARQRGDDTSWKAANETSFHAKE
jgi:flagella basal body P-ring formation protein FlgA